MARPKNPCRTNFEANLLGLMAEKGLEDYSALAAKAEIHTSTIQRLCEGTRGGSMATLKKLAIALDCKVDDLLTEETDDIRAGLVNRRRKTT